MLASASPRRLALLRQIGLDPDVETVEVDERAHEATDAGRLTARLAHAKASAVASRHRGTPVLVLAADTVVTVDGDLLGKPRNETDAVAMLRRLSGRAHNVTTAFTALHCGDGRERTRSSTTKVVFRALHEREIAAYVATGEPADKAGGYGIQGWGAVFVERVEGDYYTVVGLPLCPLAAVLAELGLPVLGAARRG